MKFRKRVLTCRLEERIREFTLIAFHVKPKNGDERFIEQVLSSIDELNATSRDPSGRHRSIRELQTTRYLGVASERILTKYLQRELGELFIVSNDPFHNYESHVDLIIQYDDRKLRIEVRGSFPFMPLDHVICKLFDVIGPYSTTYKSSEDPKDFYLRTLINKAQNQFDYLEDHIIFFVGGADISMLRNVGMISDFKKAGATYLSIKPIARARDAIEIVSDMRDFLLG